VPLPYSIQSVLDYIVDQYEAYLREETATLRSLPDYSDTRVHVCIYMVSPHAHGYAGMHALRPNTFSTT
jgi:septin 14